MKETINHDVNDELATLDDDALQSVSGGCTSTCLLTTPDFSCVPPGQQCP